MAREPSVVSPPIVPAPEPVADTPPVEQTTEERRAEGQRIVRAREEEIQRGIAEQNAVNAEYEAQPRVLLRRIQERFQKPRIGVEDRLHAVEVAVLMLTQHLMPLLPEIEEKPVPAEPPKEPTDGK